jgi:hypothetical protein
MLYSPSQDQSALVTMSQYIGKVDSKSHDDGKTMDAAQDEKDKLFCDHYNK